MHVSDIVYVVTPFLAWLTAGCLKFAVNWLRHRSDAVGLIGYGGFPSNHSSIVCSMAVLIALREGIGHPAVGVAVTLAFVVIMDALSLRRQVGRQAERLNLLTASSDANDLPPLRERMGHSPVEILGGIGTGAVVALAVQNIALILASG